MRAAVVRRERPGDGGSSLRGGVGAAVRGAAAVGPAPDETTILKFRHLLARHGLGEGLFEAIKAHLADEGHSLRRGMIEDATIVDAPSSTKNGKGERNPEMHQTKKGNQWYFGMKAQAGGEPGRGRGLAGWR